MIKLTITILLIALLAGCQGGQTAAQIAPPTQTLGLLITLTPRQTSTAVLSKTPLPTYTFTPSVSPIPPTPSDTLTPTEVPPVIGIISSMQTVNVREGPDANSPAFVALDPGTGVEVLFANEAGDWLNVQLEDGRVGWVSARLVYIEPTPTGFPTLTPSPDITALFLGTPLPTAVIGGGTITATPPRSIVTATPPGTTTVPPTVGTRQPTNTANVPVINTTAVFETATALAGGRGTAIPSGTRAATTVGTVGTTPTAGTPAPTLPPGTGSVQTGVDVLAYCDNPVFSRPAPTNLAAGSRVDVFWIWYAKTRDQVQQHLDNSAYEVRVNDKALTNLSQYQGAIRQEAGGGDYYVAWYVPSEPLTAGQNKITYRVTWTAQITDGYQVFGPGTTTLSEEGTCTFTVR